MNNYCLSFFNGEANMLKNLGYFGPIMDKHGKLNGDEICHNCTRSAYERSARNFCKVHDKIWDPKTNSCRTKKAKTKKKHKTKIGDNVFIGSNCSLIAPVNINNNSIVGAGSVVTKNVPNSSLALSRSKLIIKKKKKKSRN